MASARILTVNLTLDASRWAAAMKQITLAAGMISMRLRSFASHFEPLPIYPQHSFCPDYDMVCTICPLDAAEH